MSEWEETTIGDIVEFYDSRRIPLNSRQRAARQGPYSYYGASGVVDHIDDYIFEGRYLLVAEDGENLNSRKLPIAFFATGRFWVNNHAHIIRGREGVADDQFLKHWFADTNISGYVTGAAQPKLNQANLKRMAIRLPDYGTQRRIASILSTYDDLIENNTRRIAILEEMARRLYEEWFVHFRFPGHEEATFIDTEDGRMPEGWDVVRLDQAVEINPRTKVPKDGEKLFVPMGALSETGMNIAAAEYKTGNSGAKFMNGDTLVARITPCLENGKTGFVDFLPQEQPTACGSTEFIVLRSRTLCPQYVYLLARSNRFRDVAIKSMSGATGRQRVRTEAIQELMIVQPSAPCLERFEYIVAPLFKLIQSLTGKNRNLRTQRDILLPKLVSGEIDVSNAEVRVDVEAA
ncbi:restriction endonuclease subunit S [Thalassospira sp. NFXS8]|uniref:restriction endonuclease subunit S n=1 Tax=Thalassospira sp. NFXS8 TaxID=2819093 RepID=UPI0032DFED59